jgi:hypothetical protein
MIQYTLKCSNGHKFDSWFQSASAFDTLKARGLVCCDACGSAEVEKAIMAPRVQSGRKADAAKREAALREAQAAPQAQAKDNQNIPAKQAQNTGAPAANERPNLRNPNSDQERMLADMKRQVEENSEYVGTSFAQEARAMHVGDAPERAIHGEANLKEAKELIEDGVPVLPLPFAPKRKTN